MQQPHGVAVQIEGRITLDGENTISYGSVLHCGDAVHLGYAAIMAEYATVAEKLSFLVHCFDRGSIARADTDRGSPPVSAAKRS